MSYFHFKKSAEEERQAMTTSVFKISRGYGGCLNPPCRQRPDALEAVFTRAGSVQPTPRFLRALLTSFNFHDFEDCRTRASVPASPQKLSGSYVTPGHTAMGGTFKKNPNRLATLVAQGFQGGAHD